MNKNDKLYDSIVHGAKVETANQVKLKIANKEEPLDILNNIMIPAIKHVGELYAKHEIFLPEMVIAASSMEEGMKILEPELCKEGYTPRGKLAIGTVEGDLHDIGKNIVTIMLKGAGYEVEDLGVDCNLDMYINAVKEGAQVLLCSALLTTTMPVMEHVVSYCNKHYPDVKVILGGAPVSKDFANSIQAYAYGEDANEAIKIVDNIFGY